MPRIVYVVLPCIDPNWEGTATELTRIYLVATLGVNICSVCVPSQPIRCATTLCHFGRTRSGYVAT